MPAGTDAHHADVIRGNSKPVTRLSCHATDTVQTMSESIIPWISGYFVVLGEDHGVDLAAIPLFVAKKKVQIVEFLTYERDEVVWARVSDKKHMVPIRFSRDAVEEYTKFSKSHILQDKNAIISISKFKPFFARIPQGKGRMSEGNFLALECNSVTLIGGRGEPMFGRPEPLEADPDLKEWSEGLREHGGAGNCLKNRKQAALQKPGNSMTIEPMKPIEPPPEKADICTNKARAATVSKLHKFQEIWPICRNPVFRRPPDDVAAILASMKVDGDEDGEAEHINQNENQLPRKRRRISALPSPSPATSQSSSQTRSATPFSEAEWPPSELHRDDTPLSSPRPGASPASSIPASASRPRHPTPAQRQPRKAPSTASPSPSQQMPQENTNPPSSSSHVTVVNETMLVPSSTGSPQMHVLSEVNRKVPRPPEPFKSDRILAEPIILAPDSDLSLSLSHTQSQSQSQSQPVVLSQLSQLRRNPVSTVPDQNKLHDGSKESGEELMKRNVPVSQETPVDPCIPSTHDRKGSLSPICNDTNVKATKTPPIESKVDKASAEDEELDSDDAQTHGNLIGYQGSPSAPREVQHDPRAWAAPSFQMARKGLLRRKVNLEQPADRSRAGSGGKTSEDEEHRREVEEPRNLKEFIKAKLDCIPAVDEYAVVSWEMLYGILVGTARDRGLED